MQQRIAPEVLERIPAEQRRQTCICPACGQSQPLSPTGTPD